MNKRLRDISIQLDDRYHLTCNKPRLYSLKALCPEKQIVVTMDSFRVINHIGFLLFEPLIKKQNPSPIYNFVERYLLELLLMQNNEEVVRTLSENKVSLRFGIKENQSIQLRLRSVLSKIRPEHSIIITTDNSRYTVSWFQSDKLLFSIRFPIQYELIWGMNKMEAENLFYADLQEYNIRQSFVEQETPDYFIPVNDSCYRTDSEYYGIEEVTSVQYYKKNKNGDYLPLLDFGYPNESIHNLFTIRVNNGMQALVTQKLYGNRKNAFEISLFTLVDFCKANGCEAYVGIERQEGNHYWGIALMVNRALGYNHLFYFDVDSRIFIHPEIYKMNIELYGYVPIHNINSLYNDKIKQ